MLKVVLWLALIAATIGSSQGANVGREADEVLKYITYTYNPNNSST
jgi:hypothetical protein